MAALRIPQPHLQRCLKSCDCVPPFVPPPFALSSFILLGDTEFYCQLTACYFLALQQGGVGALHSVVAKTIPNLLCLALLVVNDPPGSSVPWLEAAELPLTHSTMYSVAN